jgi:hypothetical protein
MDRKLILLTLAVLAGCASPVPAAPDGTIVGWKHKQFAGSDMGVIVDNETGCEYIVYGIYSSGAAITPRIARNGRQICGGNPNDMWEQSA